MIALVKGDLCVMCELEPIDPAVDFSPNGYADEYYCQSCTDDYSQSVIENRASGESAAYWAEYDNNESSKGGMN